MNALPKKIVAVAGAGFGGITAALTLAKGLGKLKETHEIVLIDKKYFHLYTPALYEIAATPRDISPDPFLKSAVTIPILEIVNGRPITFLCDEITGISGDAREIILKRKGKLPYEYLILALGSETNYFNIPGLKEASFPLKTFEDCVMLRDRMERLVKEKKEVKVVFGGAGASGVELAAEFVNFVCGLKEHITGSRDCRVEYLLVDSAPDILQGFDDAVITLTKKRLKKIGVLVKTNASIASVSPGEMRYRDGTKEPFDILIWTGGVRGPFLFSTFNLPLSPKGSLAVDEYLRVQGEERIFGIGDNSAFINPKTGLALLWNVPVAEAEGRIAAKNVLAEIKNEKPKKFVPLKKYPFVLAVGRKYAIADLLVVRVSGFLGWALKQLIELRYLLFILSFPRAIGAWVRSLKAYTSND